MLRNLVIVVQRPIEAILLLRPAVCCVSRRTRIDRERGRDDLLVAVGLLLAVGSALYAPNGRAEAAAVPSTEETSEQTAPRKGIPSDVPVSANPSKPAEGASGSIGLIELTRRRNALWLDPDHQGAKPLQYAFHLANQEAVQRFTFDEPPKGNFRRGVSLWTGLDHVLHNRDRYKSQLRFEGTWQGRSVAVVDFLGPPMRLAYGNGILQRWFGYSSGNVNSMTVVFDKPTWRPLISIHGEEQIHFLDYTQTQADEQAPLRITVLNEHGGLQYDFRFQVLDDQCWLFDRSLYQGQKAAWVDEVRLDGKPPERIVRHETAIDAPEPKLFQLAEVTDRTAFNEHWEVVEQLIRRNRPWLHPSLDHLGSVEFVHTIQPGSFVERFAWRNDGASLVKVMETDEDGKWSRGKWEVITPEAALYAGSEGAKLSTRRDGKEETDFLRRTGGHLTGTQCMLAVFDVGRHPHTFAIESIERDEDNGRIKLTLRPALGRYGVGIGGTLHFHHQSKSSRAYRRNVGRVEIECDTKTRRPLHETDYDTDGAIVCKADFLDYLEVGEGEAVPQRIKVSMPHVAATVDVDYRFQWRPEGVWILQRATSQIALAEEHQSLTQVVRDVKINEPSRALEEALAEAAATREYVEAEGTQAPSPLKVYAFALGTPIQAGKAQVLFTVSHDRRLMARVDSPQTESPTSVVLVGKNGRILGATSAGADERLDFGKSEALGGAAFFALNAPTPEASREPPSQCEVLSVPLHLDREIVVDIPDQKEGKTRVKRVRLERANSNLRASVELISTDHGHYFGATACIALMDAKGRVLVAASKEIPLRVDLSEIESETVTVDLGPVEWKEEGEMVAIGLARSRDWQTFGPSMWATWIPTVQPVPFSTGQLIRAEDVGTWKIALGNLEQELHGELIPHVVLDDSQLSQIWGASRSPKKLLDPYAERMVELLARKRHEDAESLELLCRLIGYARQQDQVEVLKRHLEDERSTVRDAAAIGLGLLGDATGMARLVEIIRRPDVTLPKNDTAQHRQAWESARRRANDAAIALAAIGAEPAIEAMGKLAVEGIRRELDVRESLVILLRNSRHPAAVPYLAEIVALGDDAKGVWRLAADGLAGNRQAARDSFTQCLQNGFYAVIDRLSGTKDDYYVPLVRELFFKSDVPERPLYQAANYLWNTDTKESLEAMRELFDSNPRPDTTEPRLRLAVALAAHGDDRGFDHALQTLRELARPFDLPKDQTERRSVERGRQRREEMALDVFQRAKGLDASIVECLEKGLKSDDDHAVLAALRVVEKLRKTPDALLPLLKQLATSTNPKIATTAAQLARRL